LIKKKLPTDTRRASPHISKLYQAYFEKRLSLYFDSARENDTHASPIKIRADDFPTISQNKSASKSWIQKT
jgi:hypothetical protein